MGVRPRPWILALATLAALAALSGCGRGRSGLMGPNQAPELEIVEARHEGARGSGHLRVRWAARDDGRIDRFEWAASPLEREPGSSQWTSIAGNEWRSTTMPALPASRTAGAREPWQFQVRAVDDRGVRSAAARQVFFGENIPPAVQITCPTPSPVTYQRVSSDCFIRWDGIDPDGVFTTRPIKYKYILLSNNTEVTVQTALMNPDSVRRYYAPLAWAGWDSTSSDTTFVHFTNLILGQSFVFCVIGFDEQGDYTVPFSLSSNMLHMRIVLPGTVSPVMTVSSNSLQYTYPVGGWSTDPGRIVRVEVPAGTPVTFQWFAVPIAGRGMRSYRWTLDPPDLFDETPRNPEDTDLGRWSAPSLNTTSCTLGPFNPAPPKREVHTLYIEAQDDANCGFGPGDRSLAIIQFAVVPSNFASDLLIVDDTRYAGDMVQAGQTCPNAPAGAWPNAAELDTFLYARGGVPWQCYPGGASSTPGLFAGYAFDTLGTRGLPNRVPPLFLLARYRHVIWITDAQGATYTSLTSPTQPITGLRRASSPGQSNPLANYVAMGGRLWLAGGGSAAASLFPWDKSNNNSPRTTFSNANNELIPGRFMFDAAHLRSEIQLGSGIQATRSLGRFATAPGIYAGLPTPLQMKNAATDPLPANRTSNPGNFYQTTTLAEYLTLANPIVEDLNPDPEVLDEQSTLDTLYVMGGASSPPAPGNVVMTLYHGNDNGQVLWSGIDFWHFRRPQCQALVNWVLQDLWGLTPSGSVANAANRAPAPARISPESATKSPAGVAAPGGRRARR